MNKIKISAVSYTNTKPFVYGITHSDIINQIDLSLDIPSTCANKLIDNQVDIGLVPVAALLRIPEYHIISEYCIGADGPVNSVFIFSDKPVEEIKNIRLDEQSRTSNNLALVLLKNYWKISPEVVTGEADSFVQIGDRTFGKVHQYSFAYDLAAEWKNFTGLPFAFAVWASNKKINPEFISGLNSALKFGIDNRELILSQLPQYNSFDLQDYLMNRLDFNLDNLKREAIDKFLKLVKEL